MIQNSAEINFGGLRIVAIHSNEDPNYELSVTTMATIFCGSPAQFEAMCESHQLLIDSCLQMLHAKNGDDSDEETNAFYSIKEALRRADVLPPEKISDSQDDDLPF